MQAVSSVMIKARTLRNLLHFSFDEMPYPIYPDA